MPILLGVYAIASVVSFIAYGLDKHRSLTGGWRVRESMLHTIDALGGFAGGFAGQRFFRHKTKKVSFQVMFWATVAIHLAAWGWAIFGKW